MVVRQEALEEFDFFARDTALPCAASKPEKGGASGSQFGGSSGACATELSCDRLQKGVFRVNCVDCLDRTNVAQSVCYPQGPALSLFCVWSRCALHHDVLRCMALCGRVLWGPGDGGLVAGMRLWLISLAQTLPSALVDCNSLACGYC